MNKEEIVRMLKASAQPLLGEAKLREAAEKNWFILYGEPLPAG